MFIHKMYLVILLCPLLFTGCASTYSPVGWLPDTDEVAEQAFGGWLTIITYPDTVDSQERWLQYGGEFISVDEKNVYLMYDSIHIIPKKNIMKARLDLDEKNSGAYGFWTALGTLATLSNGFYAIFTAPFWLFSGIPATVGESSRDIYEVENPDDFYWTDVQKFARFPQGLPDKVDFKKIKPKIFFEN
jgi:hypothetical protein